MTESHASRKHGLANVIGVRQIQNCVTQNDHQLFMVAGEQSSQRMIAGLHNYAFANPLPELGLGRPKLLSIATIDQGRLLLTALLFRIAPLLLSDVHRL